MTPLQKKTSVFPLRCVLHVSGTRQAPPKNRPFGHVSIYINSLLPCGWVVLPFLQKYPVLFEILERAGLYSASLFCCKSLDHTVILEQPLLVQSHIPIAIRSASSVQSQRHSRHAYLYHLKRSGAARPRSICIGRRISFSYKHVQLSHLLRIDRRPTCSHASYASWR